MGTDTPNSEPHSGPPIMEQELSGFWRMADANFNRCCEGLRVLEDFFRFVKIDSKWTSELKSLRHDITSDVSKWSLDKRLAARDAFSDVGRTIQTETEYLRLSDHDLVHANFSRVSQSLRVLEETAKRLSLPAKNLEQCRYQSYEMQRLIQSEIKVPLDKRRKLLSDATLYIIVDGSFGNPNPDIPACPEEFGKKLVGLADAGVDIIQLRDKNLEDGTVFRLAKTAATALRATNCLFIVNDRADLAVAAGADGVHVGQEELPPEEVRKIVGPNLLVGFSTHSKQQVKNSTNLPIDYIGVGPVFPSDTKQFENTFGVDLLSEVKDDLTLPSFAIGGIETENLSTVLSAGFTRIAVSGVIKNSTKPLESTRILKRSLSNPYTK